MNVYEKVNANSIKLIEPPNLTTNRGNTLKTTTGHL